MDALEQTAIDLIRAHDAGEPLPVERLRDALGKRSGAVTKDQAAILSALKNGPKRFDQIAAFKPRPGEGAIEKISAGLTAMNALLRSGRVHIVSVVHGAGPSSRTLALGPKPVGVPRAPAEPKRTPADIREARLKRRREKAVIAREKAREPGPIVPRRDVAASWF